MKFSKKILETFIDLPADYIDLMEDVGLEVKSTDGDIMNLELLANRGDHYCYMGLAGEIYGRTSTEIKVKEIVSIEKFNKEPKLFSIKTDKCLAFSLMPLNHLRPNVSRLTHNDYIQTILPASGVNLIMDIIDITNVVMLEFGQPAHVYDADKIHGQIKIRETVAGERAALLFHDGLTELPAGTMVVADDKNILSVAGVIGCRNAAEVDENTKNILFEAALFDPVAVRKTAKALGVSSIASQIFERGGNMAAILSGAERAKYLYKQIGWEQSGGYEYSVKKWFDYKDMVINLPGDYVREQLEIEIPDNEIAKRLARYGFLKNSKCNPCLSKGDDEYVIPAWRVWDIKGQPADLIEELCRSIGYNNLPSKLPPVEIGAELTVAQIRKREIDAYFVNNGFYEIMTDNLYSPKHAATSPIPNHTRLENSVDGGYAYLRNNLIVQAAELVSKNLNVKNRDIRAYEWAGVFVPNKEKTEFGETSVLWGVMNGDKIDALDVKGLVENLLHGLNLDFEIIFLDLSGHKLHPKRSALIKVNNMPFGEFGEIHPELLSKWDIKNNTPIYFEFLTDEIINAVAKKIKYKSPPTIIPSTRDISIAVPYGKYAGDIAAAIRKKFSAVSDIKITDVFEKPKENLRNITYTLTFLGEHSADELNKLLLEIMESVK